VPATLTVAGAVASWIAAHEADGRLLLKRVLEGAISYARDGFAVTARLSSFIAKMRDELIQDGEAAELFLPGGTVPQPGTKLANKKSRDDATPCI